MIGAQHIRTLTDSIISGHGIDMQLKNMLIWALRRGQTKAMIRRMADCESPLEKFNAVWKDAVENVPFYSEWKAKYGLPDQIDDLKELQGWPILEKKDLILNREKLTRNGVSKFHESVTGGATGEPLHFRTMAGESDQVAVNKWIGWARMGIYPDSRCFLLWGHRHFYGQGFASNIRFKLRQFKDWMTNNVRADATDLSPAALREDYDLMRKFQPECIIAYSASLLALVRTMRDEVKVKGENQRFTSLKAVICTAGPLTKDERGEIADFFGVPVAMEYGSMEAGVMAYKTLATDDRYKVFDQTHILHAEEDPTTNRSSILVTGLTKRYLPLIRYRIGDYMDGVLLRDDGAVESFDEVTGRTGDMIDLGDGMRFHGYSLMVCAEENPKIVAYQLRVNKQNKKVVFVAQTTAPLSEGEKVQISRHAADVSKVPASIISVEEVKELIKAPSGKIRLVIEEGC